MISLCIGFVFTMSTSTSDEEGTQRTTIDFFTEARDNLKEVWRGAGTRHGSLDSVGAAQ